MICQILLTTLGGLGLFLFGMHLMSDALQRIAGSGLPVDTYSAALAAIAGSGW